MKKMIFAVAIAAALGFTGCATTPSKPLTFEQLGRYSATPLNAQSYRISFQARSNMSYGTAEEITLVKAAQTTLKNGYQYFKVLDDPSNSISRDLLTSFCNCWQSSSVHLTCCLALSTNKLFLAYSVESRR